MSGLGLHVITLMIFLLAPEVIGRRIQPCLLSKLVRPLKESAALTKLPTLLDKDKSAGDAKVYD